MAEFEPKILLFACNWCSYAGLDLAGTSRTQYPPNVTIVKMMCSGRLDPTYIFEAFKNGADGVLITGCHPGDCHYQEGNYKTLRKHALLKKTLAQLGIEEGRLRLEWISAAEGARAANVITEMVNSVRKLGPLQIKDA